MDGGGSDEKRIMAMGLTAHVHADVLFRIITDEEVERNVSFSRSLLSFPAHLLHSVTGSGRLSPVMS